MVLRRKKSILKSISKKRKSKLERVALIDIEITLFHVCNECLNEFKNKNDEWTFTVNDLDAKQAMKTRIAQMLIETNSNRCTLFFGSKSNYRKKIDPEYKANRSQKKPLGYAALKEWLIENYPSVSKPFMEADDMIGIFNTTKYRKHETIAISSDKDFKCIPGMLYDPAKSEEGVTTITKVQADNWHILQTLKGDTADNYKGCPGVGEVGAQKVINNASMTYKQKWDEVIALFKKAGLKKSDVLIQARLAHICRSENYNMETGKLKLWNFPK